MNAPALHQDIDTEEELRQLFDLQDYDQDSFDIHDYSYQEFVDSTEGYSATVGQVDQESFDTVSKVKTDAETFLNWIAREEEVIDISETDIYTDVSGKFGIDMNRAVLADGVHPDNMKPVEHEFYDEMPQYFTVFGLIDDEKNKTEFYYKNVHPEKILSDSDELESFDSVNPDL